MTIGRHPDNQAGRHAAKRNPANDCEYRQADTPVNSSSEDESRYTGNRESGDGFVPDVLDRLPLPCRAMG